MFYHPKYYKEMRAKRRKLQAASSEAASSKPQAFEPTCSSSKPQASSVKLQAPSSDNPEVTSSPIREPGTKKY